MVTVSLKAPLGYRQVLRVPLVLMTSTALKSITSFLVLPTEFLWKMEEREKMGLWTQKPRLLRPLLTRFSGKVRTETMDLY